MLYYSNAKINLGLNIVKKRADGFHNIETVFYPLAIRDALEFIESEVLGMSSSGIQVDCDLDQNLIIKAYRLLKEDFELPILKFHLHKVIPFGAGLGGGSANAASTLIALNQFYNLNLNEEQLIVYAQQLGADCAFFIKNHPVYAEQKGDVFEGLNLDLSNYYILLIHPGFGVSTVQAYAGVKPKPSVRSIKELIGLPLEVWKKQLVNDFEKGIFKEFPILSDLKAKMYQEGALYASMSGSGSSIFGIFETKPSPYRFKEYWHWIGKLKI